METKAQLCLLTGRAPSRPREGLCQLSYRRQASNVFHRLAGARYRATRSQGRELRSFRHADSVGRGDSVDRRNLRPCLGGCPRDEHGTCDGWLFRPVTARAAARLTWSAYIVRPGSMRLM